MAQPIWKDYDVTLGNDANGIEYRIKKQRGSIIYNGKAFPLPGTTECKARINDVCADYLTRILPTIGTDIFHNTFRVEAYLNAAWSQVDSVQMVADWSYDYNFTPLTDVPVAPIRRVRNLADLAALPSVLDNVPLDKIIPMHPQQYLPIYGNGEMTYIIYDNGDLETFQSYSGNNFTMESMVFGQSFAGLLANTNDNENEGYAYMPVNVCGGKVLYYINAYGGWDSILCEGKVQRTDNITWHGMKTAYTNTAAINRGTTTYLAEIEQNYILNINGLTSSESALMFHLLESPLVYMQDFDNGGVILPIILTGTTCQHQVTSGLHNYQVQARLAAERNRRI